MQWDEDTETSQTYCPSQHSGVPLLIRRTHFGSLTHI